jgi:membrane fusion protein (multidrug efflux system)
MNQTNGIVDKKKKLIRIGVLFLLIVAVLAVFAVRWYIDMRTYVTTEDARIAANTVKVATKLSGRIKTVSVKEGDTIMAGQLLAMLDNRDLELLLAQAQANTDAAKNKVSSILNGSRPEELDIAKSKIDMAQVSLKQANAEFNRQKVLFDQKFISQKEFDDTQNALEIAEKNLKVANDSYNLLFKGARGEDRELVVNQLKMASASRDLAEYNFTNSTISAPVGGKIVQMNVNNGEYVSVGQTLFAIINPDSVWVSANIKETDINRVKQGQKVSIFADAIPGKTFTGTVADIGIATNSTFALLQLSNSSGNFVKVVQNIPVKILIDRSNITLPVGSSVMIKILTKE